MTFHKKRSWIKMPRRKQDCPKKMKWEEGSGDTGGAAAPPSECPSDVKDDDEDSQQSSILAKDECSSTGCHLSDSGDRKETPPPSYAPSCDSPSLDKSPHASPNNSEAPTESPLDFSVRKKELYLNNDSDESNFDVCEPHRKGESPLDLSLPRKRSLDSKLLINVDKKIPRVDMVMAPPSPWGGLLHKYSPDLSLRNSVLHLSPHSDISSTSESNRALERMQELSKMGGDPSILFQSTFSPSISTWQNHWLAKGLHEQTTRDVLKCVWCKQSFMSLAELTVHMKEAKHCSMGSSQTPQSKPSSHKNSDNLSFLKDSMPLPRKLVRGQDVWLGKGAEQTKQILKCMWCGQSFTSLADMTTHMQQTQHYTNIISQEQIISWKSPDEKCATQSHVNAVLTCKVCDQAFSSLKELSSHMVKNSHYKEHIMKSISENTSRRRPSREKRKPKSLPVRKLLELERAQHDIKVGGDRDPSGRITCEKCGDKIETAVFVDHIRLCLGVAKVTKPPFSSPEGASGRLKGVEEIKSEPDDAVRDEPIKSDPSEGSSSSVLNAIEKLIEKSFEFGGKSKNGRGHVGTSILQRLGIDESVDYSKPLIDPHGFHLFGALPQNPFRYFRDRSASESSGCSDIPRKDTPNMFTKPIKVELNVDEAESPCSPKLVINEDDRDVKSFSPTSEGLLGQFYPSGASSPAYLKQEAASDKEQSPCKSVPSPASVKTDPEIAPEDSPDRSHASTPKSEDSYQISRNSTPRRSPCVGGPCVLSPDQSVGKSEVGFHPLAALQKLCEKTESHISRPGASSAMVPNSAASGVPGSILAFSWACNDAVMADSIMKCAFCDTPFISKGAYRHHLSKIHFVKDGIPPDPTTVKAQTVSKPCKSPQSKPEESPHSKFLKYTELAKQLSSKYVK